MERLACRRLERQVTVLLDIQLQARRSCRVAITRPSPQVTLPWPMAVTHAAMLQACITAP